MLKKEGKILGTKKQEQILKDKDSGMMEILNNIDEMHKLLHQ